MTAMAGSIRMVRAVSTCSLWAGVALGMISGALGAFDLALGSGLCGVLAAVAGAVSTLSANRAAALELKAELEAVRGQAIAFAVAL